jgi:DNA-binding CsgD family transcriptional regulator
MVWDGRRVGSPYRNVAVAIALQRAKAKGEYERREVSLIAKLGVHVERSLMLAMRMEEHAQRVSALMEAIPKMDAGVFLVGPRGKVTELNDAAAGFLGASLSLRNGQLEFSDRTAQQSYDKFSSRLQGAADLQMAVADEPIVIRRAPPETPLIGYTLLPNPQPGARFDVGTPIVGALLVFDPRKATPPQPSLVRDFLDITLGEARVASAFCVGSSPREVAQQLQISEDTVRTVLKRVFAKTGVSRQSELTAVVNRLGLAGGRIR